MAILRVREPFSVSIGGVQQVYREGDLVSSTDAVATPSRVALFLEPVEEAARRAVTSVEQATAAPGERRNITTRKREKPNE